MNKPQQNEQADSSCGCGQPDIIVVNSCCGEADIQSEQKISDSIVPTFYNRLKSIVGTLHLKSAWSVTLVTLLLVLLLDPASLGRLLNIAGTSLAHTSVYILIAVMLLAYLKASGAEHLVSTAFQGQAHRMIILGALIGGLAPFCSCEVIPFIAGLLALGVPLPAVMAFWLSSPLIDPASLMITAGALGWEFAIAKTVAAVSIGLIGGFSTQLMIRAGAFASPLKAGSAVSCSASSCSADKAAITTPHWKFWQQSPRRKEFNHQMIDNGLFLLKWLTLAYVFEALLVLYVPAQTIGGAIGGEGVFPIAMGAILGMPAYLNSYAAPAVVAGLMQQGMGGGAAMAFMIAGAISSIPAMTAVFSLVKKQVFFTYLALGVGSAVLMGIIFEQIY